jgi:anti-sigma regulatory factor (Ser/Thr protein kinase)
MIVEWVLPADLSAAHAARDHVADALVRRGVAHAIADDIVLVASELAANAIRHGSPPARLTLDCTAERIRVTVSNHGASGEPRILDAPVDAGHGRGLAMVRELAEQVGWERDGDRLDVWAEFPAQLP